MASKKVFMPLYDAVDVMDCGSDYKVRVAEYDRHVIEEAMLRATKAYNQKFAVDRYDATRQFRWGRNSTNYPDGARGIALLGGFLFSLLRDEYNGRTFLDWVTGPFTKFADGTECKSITFKIAIKPDGFQNWTLERWAAAVTDATQKLGHSIRNKAEDGFIAQVAATLVLVTYLTSAEIGQDDGRIATYILQTVKNYIENYLRAFGLTIDGLVEYDPKEGNVVIDMENILSFINDTSAVKYSYKEVRRFDMWEVLSSFDSMLDFYEARQLQKFYEAYHDEILQRFHVILGKSEIKIFNGYIECPDEFFAGLVAAAVRGSLQYYESVQQMQHAIELCRQNSGMLHTAAWLLNGSGTETPVPNFFEHWLPAAPTVWVGTRESLSKSVAYVLKQDGVQDVLKGIADLFNTYYTDISEREVWFPPVVSVAEVNGIRSMYHFRFEDLSKRTYALFKRGVQRGGTEDVRPISIMCVQGRTGSVVDDEYVRKSKTNSTIVGREECWGKDKIDSRKKELMLRRYYTYSVREVGADRFELEVFRIAKTIYPPLATIREFDVRIKNKVRAVEGSIWQVKSVDISDPTGISSFDLLFLFPRSVTDADNVSDIYWKRIKGILTGRVGYETQDYLPCDYKATVEVTPINEQVLSIGGYGVACEFVKTIERVKSFEVDPDRRVGEFTTTQHKIGRFLEVKFPIHKNAVNTRLYEETLDGKEIFKSADKVGKKERFVLNKKKFSNTSFSDCLEACVRLDLYDDVKFADYVRINDRNPLLKMGVASSIQLDIRGWLPGSNDIDPTMCESSLLVDKDGNTVRAEDLLNPPSGAGSTLIDVLRWAIRDTIARRCWGLIAEDEYACEMSELCDWISNEFGVGDTEMISTLTNEYHSVTLGDMRTCKAGALFQKMFGEHARTETILPSLVAYNKIVVLEDSIVGMRKFPVPNLKIVDTNLRIPSSVVPDAAQGLSTLVTTFANIALEEALKLKS